MMVIRSSQTPASEAGSRGALADPDPLQTSAEQAFAADFAACRIPSVRAIRAQLHVGQPRAQRLRTHLAILASG
jgi:hypothetical protein